MPTLVGSEMCIRDSRDARTVRLHTRRLRMPERQRMTTRLKTLFQRPELFVFCLLYTSDAADAYSRGLGDVYKRQPRRQDGSVTHEETAHARASTYDDPTEDLVSTARIICLLSLIHILRCRRST